MRLAFVLAPAAAALAALAAAASASSQTAAPGFTAAQADTGLQAYVDHCAQCHGAHLDDGEFAPSLKGVRFKANWTGKRAGALLTYMTANMPPGGTGVIAAEDYAAIEAYVLQANGAQPGDQPLPSDPAKAGGVIAFPALSPAGGR